MKVIEGIAANAPVWVWPLLAMLVLLGLRATRTRRVPLLLIYMMPLLMLISIDRVAALVQTYPGLAGYVSGLSIGALIGLRCQRRWLIQKSGRHATLRGEWGTLIGMMVIFWANFAEGVLKVGRPDILQSPSFTPLFAAIIAAAGGFFLGRMILTMMAPDTSAEAEIAD
ncbi:MAG: hypothetical protein AAGJ28_15545 [Pseudomonadota bacterium]